MQETKPTSRRKSYSALVKLHYLALQEAHICAIYVQDAEQEGESDLAQFFRTSEQEACRRAEVAQHLLDEHCSVTTQGIPVPGTPHQTGHYPGSYPEGMQSTSR